MSIDPLEASSILASDFEGGDAEEEMEPGFMIF